MSQQRSGQYLQSSHTHEQPPAGRHSSLLCRQELQGLQDCNPMGLPVKKHTQTHTQAARDEILQEITVWKNGLLFKSRIGIEDVYTKGIRWKKKMLIIDCQPVLNVVQLPPLSPVKSKVLPTCGICSCSL